MATPPCPYQESGRQEDGRETARRHGAQSKPVSTPRPQPAPVLTVITIFEHIGEVHALPKNRPHALLADSVATVATHLKGSCAAPHERATRGKT
jgi:hypothetical protein